MKKSPAREILFVDVIDRLKEYYKVNKSKDLSKKLEVNYATMATWRRRNKVPYDVLCRVANNEGISLNWLLLGAPDKNLFNGRDSSNNVYIDNYASDNQEVLSNLEVEEDMKEKHFFPLSHSFINRYLRTNSKSIENLKISTVIGNAMEPTICHNDKVFIEVQPKNDDMLNFNGIIYAVQYNDRMYIKRMQINPVTKNIRLISDNSNYVAIEIPAAEANSLKILGRVILKCCFSEIA